MNCAYKFRIYPNKDQIFYKEIIVIFDKKCYNKSKQNEEKK